MRLRTFNAGNEGAFTLGGTRTHIVGARDVAIIDPGPNLDAHLRTIGEALERVDRAVILLTHGHADHAGGAAALSSLLGAPLRGSGPGAAPLADGERIDTDAGELTALHAPGHTRDHLVFHWPGERILFPGDLILGVGETTWIGEYREAVADFLRSLDRIEALDVERILCAHGPPRSGFEEVIASYRRHRWRRIRQVGEARKRRPESGTAELTEEVYGTQLPEGLEEAARRGVEAMLHFLGEGGAPPRAPGVFHSHQGPFDA